jgi:hypothetical protein
MRRLAANYPIADGVFEGYRNPQQAGLEYVIGSPCDGWTDPPSCIYEQTRAYNAQPGPDIDVTVDYRPGLYPDGDPHPGGNSGPPGEPYSDLRRASCVAGTWIDRSVTAACFAHEIGHNFGLVPSCSPHWDGGPHSKDGTFSSPFAFDALRNVPYTGNIGDLMGLGAHGASAWGLGDNLSTLSHFDWDYVLSMLAVGHGTC